MKDDKNTGRMQRRTRTAPVARIRKAGKAEKSGGSKLARLGSLAAPAAGGAVMPKKMRSKSDDNKTVGLTAVPQPSTSSQPRVELPPPVVVDQTIATTTSSPGAWLQPLSLGAALDCPR
ncbi:MAG: hypothetical protein ACR2J0_05360 [Mycobacteriales bacterium]